MDNGVAHKPKERSAQSMPGNTGVLMCRRCHCYKCVDLSNVPSENSA